MMTLPAPIDLLMEASAESFATWLQSHPTVEVISLDRGTTFADGATQGLHRLFRLPIAGISSIISVKQWRRCWRGIMLT
jgi:hypothetical protein